VPSQLRQDVGVQVPDLGHDLAKLAPIRIDPDLDHLRRLVVVELPVPVGLGAQLLDLLRQPQSTVG
jgi:hypothetical protein